MKMDGKLDLGLTHEEAKLLGALSLKTLLNRQYRNNVGKASPALLEQLRTLQTAPATEMSFDDWRIATAALEAGMEIWQDHYSILRPKMEMLHVKMASKLALAIPSFPDP